MSPYSHGKSNALTYHSREIEAHSVSFQDRKFKPYLAEPEHLPKCIEECYFVEVTWDTGEVKEWSFDDLNWWCREHHCPGVYDRVIRSAIHHAVAIGFFEEAS